MFQPKCTRSNSNATSAVARLYAQLGKINKVEDSINRFLVSPARTSIEQKNWSGQEQQPGKEQKQPGCT